MKQGGVGVLRASPQESALTAIARPARYQSAGARSLRSPAMFDSPRGSEPGPDAGSAASDCTGGNPPADASLGGVPPVPNNPPPPEIPAAPPAQPRDGEMSDCSSDVAHFLHRLPTEIVMPPTGQAHG